ncbi:mucin-5AC-like [Culicoides brevitarsis]|uniref:mucin-5AC-like n=1 Tax=Culicoides brevitarsis TaxID=469753 RepID=UPI00307BF898
MGTTGDGMGFAYDAYPGQYQLWKPPQRGEAPPPYEEVIALAQAESMNTCTVSVATTHRTLPLTVCNSEPDISATTTNLINININNAGSITAVAAGENHIRNQYVRSPNNTITRTNELPAVVAADPSSTAIYPMGQQLISSLPREIPCTLQNCELNTTTITNQIASMGHRTTTQATCLIRGQMPKEVQTSNQSISANNTTIATILPPPLFNTPEPLNTNLDTEPLIVSASNSSEGLVDAPKTPKRYHRTIPRNVTANDGIMANLKPMSLASSGAQSPNNNKKPACQCPIQHIPNTYMGSTQITAAAQQNTQSLFLSTLTTKLNNVAAKQSSSSSSSTVVSKSTSFPSTSQSGTIQTISRRQQELVPTNLYPTGPTYDPTTSIRRLKPSLLKLEAAHPNALGITSANTPRRQPPKPILKTSSRNNLIESRSHENLLTTSYPIEPNPVLPPKLYKTSSQKLSVLSSNGDQSTYATTRDAQFSLLNSNRHSAEMSSLRMRHSNNNNNSNNTLGNNTLPKNSTNKQRTANNVKPPAGPHGSKQRVMMHRHADGNKKPLPVLNSTNCTNPKQHFLPNDASLDDDYLSECENCKTANGSRYYLNEEDGETMETMTLQRKMPETSGDKIGEEQQGYYRVSATLPSNTNKKQQVSKSREPWFATIPASSSSEEDEAAE